MCVGWHAGVACVGVHTWSVACFQIGRAAAEWSMNLHDERPANASANELPSTVTGNGNWIFSELNAAWRPGRRRFLERRKSTNERSRKVGRDVRLLTRVKIFRSVWALIGEVIDKTYSMICKKKRDATWNESWIVPACFLFFFQIREVEGKNGKEKC